MHCPPTVKNSEQQKPAEPANDSSRNPGEDPGARENSGSPDSSPPPGKILYRKLKAPADHGGVLITPADIDALWTSNLESHRVISNGTGPLAGLAEKAQREILRMAVSYTRRYRDVEIDESTLNQSRIVMSGHQPALFHPGVWFKNFLLSSIGQQFGCVALNLVVDNDVCSSASVRAPSFDSDPVTMTGLEIDQPYEQIPFELRKIQDEELFASFGTRAASAIASLVGDPLVTRLWPHVLASRDPEDRFGHSLAAGRHRQEQEYGLNTLEVPVSQLAKTRAFATVAFEIFSNAARYAEIYNDSLFQYRRVHRIRSHSHPVPALDVKDDGWIEVPFWIWQESSPFRKRLFVRKNVSGFDLSDLEHVKIHVPRKTDPCEWTERLGEGVAIRPRALVLTMFSRTLLSHLFVHGIGGAKYDQLTDAIAFRYYGVQLPGYLTATATMKLPSEYQHQVPERIADVDRQLREIEFHPETLLDDQARHSAAGPIADKREWIEKENVPGTDQRRRHRRIVASNQQMQPLLGDRRNALQDRRSQLAHEKRANRILGSREFSFCLFPESLPDQLRRSL